MLVKMTLSNFKVKTESAKKMKMNLARRQESSSPFKKKKTPARVSVSATRSSKSSTKPGTQRPSIRSLIFNWEERNTVLTPAVRKGPNLETKH